MKHTTNEKKLNSLKRLTFISALASLMILTVLPLLFISGKHEFIGNYGSFLSGAVGTALSMVTIYFVYQTFKLQKKQLKSQKKELAETRNQLKRQQFENIYFKMLDVVYEMGSEIERKSLNGYFSVFRDGLINDYVSLLSRGNSIQNYHKFIIQKICSTHNNLYTSEELLEMNFLNTPNPLFLTKLHDWRDSRKIELTADIIGFIYECRFIKSNSPFGNYFRYIINAIEYVEREITKAEFGKNVKEERNKYLKLLSALLTNNQLAVLFYSCLSRISYDTNGQPKAKEMMEEYEFFKNLLPENLISPWHQEFYKIPYKFPYDKTKDGPENRL